MTPPTGRSRSTAALATRSLPFEAEYRNARVTRIYDGTDEIQKVTIADQFPRPVMVTAPRRLGGGSGARDLVLPAHAAPG